MIASAVVKATNYRSESEDSANKEIDHIAAYAKKNEAKKKTDAKEWEFNPSGGGV